MIWTLGAILLEWEAVRVQAAGQLGRAGRVQAEGGGSELPIPSGLMAQVLNFDVL